MPATLTYPGVYIEEIPSGVHTITGVSTSVTAFVGSAKRGSIDKATHILSFSDYERRFGGLAPDSEMSYAVRQFFLNGGSEAWVVRLSKDPVAASRILQNDVPQDVLGVTALDEGRTGNDIEVRVDHQTSTPFSTFNLTVSFTSIDNPADSKTETFQNLSMNSDDSHYVEDIVNGTSELVTLQRVATGAILGGLGKGTSVSGQLGDVAVLVDPTHNRIRILVNGLVPVAVEINPTTDLAGGTTAARLASLCAAIQAKVVAAASGQPALTAFTCAPNGSNDGMVLTSGQAGEKSSVRVLRGLTQDAAVRLKLGTESGGTETDAAAAIRPVDIPLQATLTSGVFVLADLAAIPDATHKSFQIQLDDFGPETVTIPSGPLAGATLAAKLADLAARIQTAVRALKPNFPAYRDFTATVKGGTAIQLASGTRGTGSNIKVADASPDTLATALKLLANPPTQPEDILLTNGTESPYTDAEAYSLFIADRSKREGIFALESVDLFNLLCLPGVSDSGILADAISYCVERRAFLIIDPPPTTDKPEEMLSLITGPNLPKEEHGTGAVYYPWIKIADPLKNGKLRSVAPSGTIAGLYARTDSARGVWKAPAGTEAALVGVQGVAYPLTDLENGTLNPRGVNCLRIFPVFGPVAWGARTTRGDDQMTDQWKYIPVRRLALFLEESLYRGTKWIVFEPNDEPLWAQIRLNLGAFMQTLFRQGAFQGSTPRDAYFVKCDKETTTQNDIDLGIVNIVVGFAPLKPAEFVVIKIQQIAGQIAV
jgi:phage tail sheath protein FI